MTPAASHHSHLPTQLIDGLDRLDHAIDSMLAELAQLVALDTCFPPSNSYAACADLLDRLCADLVVCRSWR